MQRANIAFIQKNKTVKSVTVLHDTSLDLLGVELNDYFKDLSDVKELVVSTIEYIDSGEPQYVVDIDACEEEDLETTIYDNREEFIDDIDPDTYYYLFENDCWNVCKPGHNEFRELEIVLDEEY